MNNKNPYYNPKIQKIVNKIVSEEWIAGQMYRLYLSAVSKEYKGMLSEGFMKISEDETEDHMQSVIDWADEYGYSVPCKVSEFEKYSDEVAVRLYKTFSKNKDVKYYIDNAIKAEMAALESYKQCLEVSELQEFGDLQAILLKNYYEEIQHAEDLGVMNYTYDITVNME